MLLETERKAVIEYCLLSVKQKLTNGTAGNISILNREKKLIAISPTGVNYNLMKPEDVSILDLEGNLIEGLKPSSEWQMHLTFYQKRKDVNAIFHGHTVYATILACLNKELPAVDYMVAVSNMSRVPCAKYATFGTKELAQNAYLAGKDGNAVLLANHGILTYSASLSQAFKIATQVEYVAMLYVNCLQTNIEPVILDDSEMQRMLAKFKTYGQSK